MVLDLHRGGDARGYMRDPYSALRGVYVLSPGTARTIDLEAEVAVARGARSDPASSCNGFHWSFEGNRICSKWGLHDITPDYIYILYIRFPLHCPNTMCASIYMS